MMARRILVVTTAAAPEAEVEAVVRAHAGEDAEVYVVAPASKISWLARNGSTQQSSSSETQAKCLTRTSRASKR